MSKKIIGYVHSIETLGTRDGPGLRCVFFLAGCNYRCSYCQNRDTWSMKSGSIMTLVQAEEQLTKLLPYLKKHGGGVTVSGGEPTLQPEFVLALFKLSHRMGLSTALDTNGTCSDQYVAKLLRQTDLVMLDIKACDPKLHREITGQSNRQVFEFGRQAAQQPGRLLIRRVLLPGINDSKQEWQQLSDYALSLPHQPEIELISYHRLGVHKWSELKKGYPLDNLKPPTAGQWQRAADYLSQQGLTVNRG